MALLDILLKFPAIKIVVVLTHPFLKNSLTTNTYREAAAKVRPYKPITMYFINSLQNITVHRKVKRSCIKQIGKDLENVNQFKHLMQFT